MLSSRTLHMTSGVQESRQEHNKDEPKYQLLEDECDMLSNYSNLWKKNSRNEHSTQCHFIFHHWIVPNLALRQCLHSMHPSHGHIGNIKNQGGAG